MSAPPLPVDTAGRALAGAAPALPPAAGDAPIRIDAATLRAWPLPVPGDDADKEERGRLLIVAGSVEMPGAAILAAQSALRAGVGKLGLVVPEPVAIGIALAVPEARVIAWRDDASAQQALLDLARRADALLIGPGMQDTGLACRLAADWLPQLGDDTRVVLDACAMDVVLQHTDRFSRPVLLTPHAGEMAHLTGQDKTALRGDPVRTAREAAARWNAVVALKGPLTCIALPDGRCWQHQGGNIGLAVSGSGDTLAGMVAGLAARGATLEQAAAWGVALHARAGDQLARRWGLLGYLAREIPAEVPGLMEELQGDGLR